MNQTCIKIPGEAVAVASQAMHKIGVNKWVISDASRRVLGSNNPRIKVGVSYANVSDYTLNLLTGEVLFTANVPADNATVVFVGDYLPMGHVGGANKFTLNSDSVTEDITAFEDLDLDIIGADKIPSRVFAVGDSEVKASIDKVINVNDALWLKAMIARNTVMLQLVFDNGDLALGWFMVVGDNISANKITSREAVSFVLSGDLALVSSPTQLRLKGNPAITVAADAEYRFIPTVSGSQNPLTFGILNMPAWASFDTSTGELTGTPIAADVGDYNGIVIDVSDGTTNLSLDAFDISVTA